MATSASHARRVPLPSVIVTGDFRRKASYRSGLRRPSSAGNQFRIFSARHAVGEQFSARGTSRRPVSTSRAIACGIRYPHVSPLPPTLGRSPYSRPDTAMIKVSVMYPNKPGCRFDHGYYRDKHMPLVKERMGSACLFYTVDKGLSGRTPGEPAPYCWHVPHLR